LDGLLLKLARDGPQPRFWKLFDPIRQDLDRLFWCFTLRPWMGAPDGFREDESATESFERIGIGYSETSLWRPGSLGKYADFMGEEFIELWGIEPTVDDPRQVTAQYDAARDQQAVLRQFARVWLRSTMHSCWEIYARKPRLLEEVREHVRKKRLAEPYESHADRRAEAFAAAGLSQLWKGCYGV
jgi:hypothetical protein